MKGKKHWLWHVLISVFCLYLAAQISFDLPLSDLQIPITGQTLGVILVSYFNRNKFGILAVLIYLFLGGVGLPIFAEGASGWAKFSGGTGGFLIGFLLCSVALYWVKQYLDIEKTRLAFLVNILGTIVIVSAGVLWLSVLYGFEKGLEYGFFPFWRGAIVKVVLGSLIIIIYELIFEKLVPSESRD